ncbi:UNVERIFIED_CONTAM: hypothetical protein K2H54_044863 [Gekko kuhli]
MDPRDRLVLRFPLGCCVLRAGLQHFKESIKFVHECRLHGGRCLIHCLAGVSRSTTLLIAYLMTVTNLGWEECLAAIKTVRSYVSPNFGFQQQLQEYEETSLRENDPVPAELSRMFQSYLMSQSSCVSRVGEETEGKCGLNLWGAWAGP